MSRFCGKCGKPLSENEKFCPYCGAKQLIGDQGGQKNGSEAPPAHGNQPGNHGGKKWAAIAALCAVAIAVGLGIFWWMRSHGDSLDAEDVLAAIENYQEVNDSIIALTSMEEYAALETPEKAEMVLAVLENLAEEEKVEADSIGYDADNVMIYFTYADGAYGGVMLEDFAEGVDGVGEASYDTLCDGSFLYNWPSVPDFGLDTSPYTQENLSALIVCDLGDEDATHLAQQEADVWNETYLETMMVDSGTVSFFRKGLLGYDLVIIREHGSIYNGDPAIALQETANWLDAIEKQAGVAFTDEEKAIVQDLKANRLALVLCTDGQRHYFLLPEFFSYYYGNGKLAYAIVWLGCCYGYYDANASLVSAFANCGAKAVLAATDSINRGYGFLMQDAFTYMLLCGYDVEDSLEFAKSQWGYNDAVFAAIYCNASDEDPAEICYFNGGKETLVTLTSDANALMEEANALENEQGFYRIPARFYSWNDEGEGTVLLYGETVYKDVFNIDSGPMQTSMDCSKILLEPYTENRAFSLLSENGEIVTIDRGTAAHFAFSLDGSTVLYVSWDRDLVLFDVNTSQKTTVCHEDAFFGTLSPDGTQVLYATGWYDETVIYRYDGETSIKIGEGYTPISISDDGKCIYAYQVEENALYTFDESGEWKKISDEPSNVFLSSDHTEILFHADAKTYISTNGGEKEMISASQIEPLSWSNLTFTEYGGYCDAAVCNSSLFDQIYVTSDFYSSDYIYTNEYDNKYSDSSDFYYISPRYAAERIASNVECFAASVDYSTVYYISGGKLYHASSADAYASEEIAAEGTAAHVYISDYGETAYYLTADGVLYCIESDGSSDKVSGGVETVAGFYNGYFYFTTSDNTLYYASQAAKTEVSSNVYSCFVSATGAYYVTADGDLYGSESGTQFSCLLSSHDGDYEEPDNTVESTDTLAYEMRKEVIEFTLSDGTLYYQNVIEYPYFLGNSAVETIINSRYASLIQKCKETTRDFDAEHKSMMEIWNGFLILPFYDDVSAEVTYCENGLVSIKECNDMWSGGMHPYQEYSGHTYRISDGTELGVSDFLSGPDAENEKLVTKYKQGIVDYFDANFVMASPFVLTEEGLCFICNVGDAVSRVEVIIPYSELSMPSP